MAKSFVIFLFCVFAARCAAQVILPGHCLNLPPKVPFSLKEFSGLWNQQASFGSNIFGGYGECSAADYTVSPVTGLIQIEYHQRIIIGHQIQTISGKGIMPDPQTGRLLIYYFVPYHGVVTAELIIVDTDYNNWCILYSCTELAVGHSSASWIMTRADDLMTDPSEATINLQINAALEKVGLSRNNYITFNSHGECNDVAFS